MNSFKELDPAKIREILDARTESGELIHQDVLTPLAKREQELFASSPCPKCGAQSVAPILDIARPFTSASPLARRVLRCVLCETQFDPRTGLITKANITFSGG
jgi:hypothetical protein